MTVRELMCLLEAADPDGTVAVSVPTDECTFLTELDHVTVKNWGAEIETSPVILSDDPCARCMEWECDGYSECVERRGAGEFADDHPLLIA